MQDESTGDRPVVIEGADRLISVRDATASDRVLRVLLNAPEDAVVLAIARRFPSQVRRTPRRGGCRLIVRLPDPLEPQQATPAGELRAQVPPPQL